MQIVAEYSSTSNSAIRPERGFGCSELSLGFVARAKLDLRLLHHQPWWLADVLSLGIASKCHH